MIDWLFDRWWVWKNRAELDALDQQPAFLQAEGERLDREMEEMFGPDWRAEGERRLERAMTGRYTVT